MVILYSVKLTNISLFFTVLLFAKIFRSFNVFTFYRLSCKFINFHHIIYDGMYNMYIISIELKYLYFGYKLMLNLL